MNFLIVTEPEDMHAIAVSLVLEENEHTVVNLFSGDFPSCQRNSVFIASDIYQVQTEDKFNTFNHNGYDVVWWRRPRHPILKKDMVHPDDEKFHHRETHVFFDNFGYLLAPGAWWINRKEAAIRSNHKLLQLKKATDVGLKIPSTLCSNRFEDIVSFFYHHSQSGIIYKPLTYQVWNEQSGYKILYTSKIDSIAGLNPKTMQLFPGLYQEYIEKKFELRITCFGDFIIAAKLNSQKYQEGLQDWRVLSIEQLDIEPYQLPNGLEQKIRFLMRELGIVFGCIDMIVTPQDDYIFLEVNEQGQFLFLEQCCEDLPMLDIFIQFMLQQSIDFHWIKRHHLYRMDAYSKQIKQIYHHNLSHHLSAKC
jgi:glutathione synthase/RimK-type ligase-like ATP-grasp enzyme